MNAIITTVLDLDAALGPEAGLLLGGGLGLYLKQRHLLAEGARTLISWDELPPARTTRDIDLFLRAEVIADSASVRRHRGVLDALGFSVVKGAEWLKFERGVGGTRVLLDIMVGPVGEHAGSVRIKGARVRPQDLPAERGLHAFSAQDAIGVEHDPMPVLVEGHRSDGTPAACRVMIPRAFPYLLMKLGALRDRIDDADKDLGRHHAMDLYRIIGLLTRDEDDACMAMAERFADHPQVRTAAGAVDRLFGSANALGRLRLLEYQRLNSGQIPRVDVDLLLNELRRFFPTRV
jgi:hypothetical protein